MTLTETNLKGSYIIEPELFEDSRGYFFESFRHDFLKDSGIDITFVQENESRSKKGVLRGLHYQLKDKSQAKLVRVVRGRILDVIVDLRKPSPTFGQHFKTILSDTNKKQLLIPRGFAHGFLVLEDNTVFTYKCDNYYDKDYERGIRFNDEYLDIDWGSSENKLLLSEKDLELPLFKDAEL